MQKYWLPTIGAAIALQRKDPNRAVELSRVSSPIELSQPMQITGSLFPVYLRGEAFLMLHDGDAAAEEFRKFLEHRGLVANSPWGPLARLGLARAYSMQGDKARARPTYQDFLTLWKDADSDVPILHPSQSGVRQIAVIAAPSPEKFKALKQMMGQRPTVVGHKPAYGTCAQKDLANKVMDQNQTSGELRCSPTANHQCNRDGISPPGRFPVLARRYSA